MGSTVLSELRVLGSTRFDSRIILSVILAGDSRLVDRLRREELLPLGSRIRTRLNIEPASRDDLLDGLRHRMKTSGNATLMTAELMDVICDHSVGNYRVMLNIASDLLDAAARRELTQLDEKLYLEVFSSSKPPTEKSPRGRVTARRRQR